MVMFRFMLNAPAAPKPHMKLAFPNQLSRKGTTFPSFPRGLFQTPDTWKSLALPQPQGRCHSCCQLAATHAAGMGFWRIPCRSACCHQRQQCSLHPRQSDICHQAPPFPCRWLSPFPGHVLFDLCPFWPAGPCCQSPPRTTARHLLFQAASSRHPGWPWGHNGRSTPLPEAKSKAAPKTKATENEAEKWEGRDKDRRNKAGKNKPKDRRPMMPDILRRKQKQTRKKKQQERNEIKRGSATKQQQETDRTRKKQQEKEAGQKEEERRAGKGSQDMMRKRCVQREQAVLMEQEKRKENQ